MSDAHSPQDGHQGPIRTPKQLIIAVVAAFLVPIFAIVLLVNYVSTEKKPSAGSTDAMSEQAVATRIQPVGHVEVKDASDLSALKSGEEVFKA
ncbi:MAG TPA: cytochrome c5 family protein, partial [Methylibium sp.]